MSDIDRSLAQKSLGVSVGDGKRRKRSEWVAKFRIGLGIFLMLMGFGLLWIGFDAEQSGIDLAEPDGTRGAALFDLFGKWGVFILLEIYGLIELTTGLNLLKNKK